MEGTRISYHESVRRVYDRIKNDGMTTFGPASRPRAWAPILTRGAPSAREGSVATCVPMGRVVQMHQRVKKGCVESLPTAWLCG